VNNILVAIDGSAAALRALAVALRLLSQRPDIGLHLLNVQAPLVQPWPSKLVSPDMIEAELCSQAEPLLAPAVAQARAAGVPCQTHVRIGAAATEVVDCAQANRCDAILMGTRGLGAVAGVMLGSVARQVVHLASVPVTLVK
jgi:nucleotide-binding universal stress UspA family protein